MGYTAIITKTPDGYIGQCEQLPEALSQGSTVEELLKNLADAIKLVLEARKEQTQKGYKGQKFIRRKISFA
jgi:predicted RNase H-like HicB family nuclease